MSETNSPCEWLFEFGVRRHRSGKLILDGFDCEFYLYFDDDPDDDRPEVLGTCDIHIVPIGRWPTEGLRVVQDCNRPQVMRFLFALGVNRFSEKTKKALYAMSNPLRTNSPPE